MSYPAPIYLFPAIIWLCYGFFHEFFFIYKIGHFFWKNVIIRNFVVDVCFDSFLILALALVRAYLLPCCWFALLWEIPDSNSRCCCSLQPSTHESPPNPQKRKLNSDLNLSCVVSGRGSGEGPACPQCDGGHLCHPHGRQRLQQLLQGNPGTVLVLPTSISIYI